MTLSCQAPSKLKDVVDHHSHKLTSALLSLVMPISSLSAQHTGGSESSSAPEIQLLDRDNFSGANMRIQRAEKSDVDTRLNATIVARRIFERRDPKTIVALAAIVEGASGNSLLADAAKKHAESMGDIAQTAPKEFILSLPTKMLAGLGSSKRGSEKLYEDFNSYLSNPFAHLIGGAIDEIEKVPFASQALRTAGASNAFGLAKIFRDLADLDGSEKIDSYLAGLNENPDVWNAAVPLLEELYTLSKNGSLTLEQKKVTEGVLADLGATLDPKWGRGTPEGVLLEQQETYHAKHLEALSEIASAIKNQTLSLDESREKLAKLGLSVEELEAQLQRQQVPSVNNLEKSTRLSRDYRSEAILENYGYRNRSEFINFAGSILGAANVKNAAKLVEGAHAANNIAHTLSQLARFGDIAADKGMGAALGAAASGLAMGPPGAILAIGSTLFSLFSGPGPDLAKERHEAQMKMLVAISEQITGLSDRMDAHFEIVVEQLDILQRQLDETNNTLLYTYQDLKRGQQRLHHDLDVLQGTVEQGFYKTLSSLAGLHRNDFITQRGLLLDALKANAVGREFWGPEDRSKPRIFLQVARGITGKKRSGAFSPDLNGEEQLLTWENLATIEAFNCHRYMGLSSQLLDLACTVHKDGKTVKLHELYDRNGIADIRLWAQAVDAYLISQSFNTDPSLNAEVLSELERIESAGRRIDASFKELGSIEALSVVAKRASDELVAFLSKLSHLEAKLMGEKGFKTNSLSQALQLDLLDQLKEAKIVEIESVNRVCENRLIPGSPPHKMGIYCERDYYATVTPGAFHAKELQLREGFAQEPLRIHLGRFSIFIYDNTDLFSLDVWGIRDEIPDIGKPVKEFPSKNPVVTVVEEAKKNRGELRKNHFWWTFFDDAMGNCDFLPQSSEATILASKEEKALLAGLNFNFGGSDLDDKRFPRRLNVPLEILKRSITTNLKYGERLEDLPTDKFQEYLEKERARIAALPPSPVWVKELEAALTDTKDSFLRPKKEVLQEIFIAAFVKKRSEIRTALLEDSVYLNKEEGRLRNEAKGVNNHWRALQALISFARPNEQLQPIIQRYLNNTNSELFTPSITRFLSTEEARAPSADSPDSVLEQRASLLVIPRWERERFAKLALFQDGLIGLDARDAEVLACLSQQAESSVIGHLSMACELLSESLQSQQPINQMEEYSQVSHYAFPKRNREIMLGGPLVKLSKYFEDKLKEDLSPEQKEFASKIIETAVYSAYGEYLKSDRSVQDILLAFRLPKTAQEVDFTDYIESAKEKAQLIEAAVGSMEDYSDLQVLDQAPIEPKEQDAREDGPFDILKAFGDLIEAAPNSNLIKNPETISQLFSKDENLLSEKEIMNLIETTSKQVEASLLTRGLNTDVHTARSKEIAVFLMSKLIKGDEEPVNPKQLEQQSAFTNLLVQLCDPDNLAKAHERLRNREKPVAVSTLCEYLLLERPKDVDPLHDIRNPLVRDALEAVHSFRDSFLR